MTTSTQTKSNELKLTRFFEAPVSAVWDAWTDQKQVGKWWGPRGFTITTHSKELKVGGHWNYTMHGPDGVDYPNKTKYFEVIKPSADGHAKLVYDHGGNDERKPLFRVTALFKSVKGGTLLDMTMAFPTPEDAAQGRTFIKKAGGDATWDRLAEYLTKSTNNKEVFVINRSFDTDINTMWEMWTDPKHFFNWLPPTGMKTQSFKGDVRAGKKATFAMTAENGGMTLHGGVEYVKLEKPNLLQYLQQFLDEKGNISRHPFMQTWPETMLTTVQLTEEAPNKTRVTVAWEPYGKTSTAELDTFIKQRAGMTQGWTGSFDKLEKYVGGAA